MAPEKTLVTEPVASATPSMTPIVSMLVPRTVVMNAGSSAWTSSEDASMHSDPKPRTHTPAGTLCLSVGDGPGPDLASPPATAHRRTAPVPMHQVIDLR